MITLAAKMDRLSFPLQEYLEWLWVLQVDEGNEAVKTGDLSKRLRIRPASVTEALHKLSRLGLVSHNRYYGASLTAKGKALAATAIRRHRLAECLFVNLVGVPKDEVEAAACGFEHYLDAKLASRVCRLLGHPRKCPHSRAIPKGNCCRP